MGIMSSSSKRDENDEPASTRGFRSSIGRGVEVESTRLAVGLRWKFGRKEGVKVGSCETGLTVDDSTGSPSSKKPAIRSY